MPKPTYQQATEAPLDQLSKQNAVLVSGQNPDGTPWALPTTGLQQRWRDEFAGTSALDANAWTTAASGTGASVSNASASVVTLNTGTTSGAYAEITTKRQFQPGVRIYVTLNAIGARIANQEFVIELVEAGTATNVDGNNNARWSFTGTTVTNGTISTRSQGDAGTAQTVAVNTTASASVFEIDLGHEEAWFYNTLADSSAGRNAGQRISRKVPDPNVLYNLRIRAKNTAAAATTALTIDSVLVEDYSFLPIELVRSRGSNAVGESLPTQIVNTPNVNLGTGGSANNVGNVGLNANGAGNRVGKVVMDGFWAQETISATLAAGASANGGARDCMGATSGSAIGTTATPREFRGFSAADQAHTLFIEGSDDATTWDRIAEAASTVKGGKSTAVLSTPVYARYLRVGVTNTSGSAFTSARMRSLQIG